MTANVLLIFNIISLLIYFYIFAVMCKLCGLLYINKWTMSSLVDITLCVRGMALFLATLMSTVKRISSVDFF